LPTNVAEILHECRFFSHVGVEGFRRLFSIAQIRDFAKGRRIFREGQPCPGMYIVDTGLVRVFKTAATGKEHVLHMVGPGDTFAEVAAIGGFECPAHAEAVTDTRCVLLPTDLFQKALREDHQLCLEMITSLSFWVRHLVGLMEDVVLRTAAGRIARYLLTAATGDQTVVELPSLKRHVASHLNLTSETFSRTLRKLIDAGLVAEHADHRVELLDRRRLELVAEGLDPEV
jgi:CRP/FNR family transcriptional regulator